MLSVLVHICDPSTWEWRAGGGSRVQGRPWLQGLAEPLEGDGDGRILVTILSPKDCVVYLVSMGR